MTPILFLLGKRLSWGSSDGAAGLICHFSCSRCGKARVWWRPAGWCWVRPTLQNLSPEPSEETSASMSASEFELQLLQKIATYIHLSRQWEAIYTLWLIEVVLSGFSVGCSFPHLLLLFSQEHHPWQWLSGKCQQGDFPVVYRWWAGQLHKLCL